MGRHSIPTRDSDTLSLSPPGPTRYLPHAAQHACTSRQPHTRRGAWPCALGEGVGLTAIQSRPTRPNEPNRSITRLDPDLFLAVTGLTFADFHHLVRLKVFNTEQMNQAVFASRRYEDASLRYTGIDSHPGLTHFGLYDTVVARD